MSVLFILIYQWFPLKDTQGRTDCLSQFITLRSKFSDRGRVESCWFNVELRIWCCRAYTISRIQRRKRGVPTTGRCTGSEWSRIRSMRGDRSPFAGYRQRCGSERRRINVQALFEPIFVFFPHISQVIPEHQMSAVYQKRTLQW